MLEIDRRHEVKITIENVPEPTQFLMKSAGNIIHFYDELSEDMGVVLEIVHANPYRQIKAFILQLTNKIVNINVSYNDRTKDEHIGRGYGTID